MADIVSYQTHIPAELKSLRIWGVAIGKRPTLPWKNPKNLFMFNEVMKKLNDPDWIQARRNHIIKERPDLADAEPRLMAVLTNTKYFVQDYDFRKLPDGSGKKKGSFDKDQLEALEFEKSDNWGYLSSSGVGYHLWNSEPDGYKLCKIQDNHLNTIAEEGERAGKYLAPFELKHDVIYFPPKLQPINDVKTIRDADGIVKRSCSLVTEYRERSKTEARANTTVKPTPTETSKDTGHDAAAPPPPLGKKHKDTERFIAQCRWMLANGKTFIPDRSQYSGFIIRAKSMGIPDEQIVKLCKSQPNFNEDTDPADIANVAPREDVDDQVAIAFSKLSELGYDKTVNLRYPIDYYNPKLPNVSLPADKATPLFEIKDIGDIADDIDKPAIIHPFMPERGYHWLMSADAFSGKTTLFTWWCRQLNDDGLTNLLIAADMREKKLKKRQLELGCKTGLSSVLDLDKYADDGSRLRLTRDDLVAMIERWLEAKKVTSLGTIILDPGNKIIGRIWQSIAPRGYRGRPIEFDEKSRTIAEDVSGMVFKFLAERFYCVVGAIGHPAKAKEGRSRYPGHVAWEAEAEYVFRLYKQGGTDIENQPKVVRKLFRGKSNQQALRVLEAAKTRDNEDLHGIYLTQLIKDENDRVTELMTEKVDTSSLDDDDTEVYPVPQYYISDVREHLRTCVGKPVGFTELHKAIERRRADYNYCVGILFTESCKRNNALRYKIVNGKPLFYYDN